MATTAAAALSLKLLVDSKAQRVLFAEASKDVVDFLFFLLALPIGTAVKLLGKDSMVGCVGNLYANVEKLDATYVQLGTNKDSLLHPAVLSPATSANSSILGLPAPSTFQVQVLPKTFFRCAYSCYWREYGYSDENEPRRFECSRCHNYTTDTRGTVCLSCGDQMITEVQFVSPSGSGRGQTAHGSGRWREERVRAVQGIVTYTVMDDLTVSPMSSISSIALLNTFAVKDLSALQEKTVQLGYNEGLAILKASLECKTILTTVFLGKKPTTSGA